jgi:hypothetical protein
LNIHPANLICLAIQEINYGFTNILAQTYHFRANTIGFGEEEAPNKSQYFAYSSRRSLSIKL